MMTLTGGCNFEFVSDIKRENQALEKDISNLRQKLVEIATIEEDLEVLRVKVSQRHEELKNFKKEFPEVVEYAIKKQSEN
jgi:hypothetical protein